MSIVEIFGGVCALALAVPATATETIGQWDFAAAPTTASLLQGGGAFFDWLNEDDSWVGLDPSVTLDRAFSDFSIIADGYGNAEGGTIVEVSFDPGVVNGDGSDLVFLEARFVPDPSLYAITVEGYEPTLLVGQDNGEYPASGMVGFSDSGEDRSYFYGFNGQQDTADIFGAEIDLSFFGIGAGQILEPLTLRFEVLTGFRAPLGFGAFTVPAPGSFVLLTISAVLTTPRRRRGWS